MTKPRSINCCPGKSKKLRNIQTLRFVDITGVSRASSWRSGMREIELSDLRLHHADPDPTRPRFFVGPLNRSRYNQEWVLPVARNLYDSNLNLIGLVVADVQVSYFFDFYKRVTNLKAIVSLRTLMVR